MTRLFNSLWIRLNPFDIREGFKWKLDCDCLKSFRLNPFDIREGFKSILCVNSGVNIGLNPFDIREGFKWDIAKEYLKQG